MDVDHTGLKKDFICTFESITFGIIIFIILKKLAGSCCFSSQLDVEVCNNLAQFYCTITCLLYASSRLFLHYIQKGESKSTVWSLN